jgi:methionyl-tRNA synthetase
MLDRFASCYELPGFSVNRAAETVLTQLARLRRLAEASGARVTPGDLLLEVRTLLAGAAPILVDVADRAGGSSVDLRLTADPPEAVGVFELPRLPGVDRTSDVVLAGSAAGVATA